MAMCKHLKDSRTELSSTLVGKCELLLGDDGTRNCMFLTIKDKFEEKYENHRCANNSECPFLPLDDCSSCPLYESE